MLLHPPGPASMPLGLPHMRHVQAVDDALIARGIPRGTVRADFYPRHRGLATWMKLTWDISRTSGHGGIRLHWIERQGWSYALLGPNPYDVTLYAGIASLRTPVADPENVACIAEGLLYDRRLPEIDYRGSGRAPRS
ncbi:hypothetical protein ABZ848_46205 [Streptomyces sp. NPDC047081]|uniref:hypothetical protein n=1 Tax=Streptomyces sp. NPDC047081 TaxID=3154706 RepID=UPI003409F755